MTKAKKTETLSDMTTKEIPSRYQDYKSLAKSGIIGLVAVTALTGYLAGTSLEHPWSWFHFLRSMLSIICLSAASAALNQIQEIEQDKKMDRTSNRPLPTGRIKKSDAILFTSVLMLIGFVGLLSISSLVFAWGLLAVFSYNVLYTKWWKPKMAFGAVPGAIPGALPVLMGYQAASGDPTDPRGYFLFSILFFWQMPHFWVLALKYSDDYASGGFPILPVAKGVEVTRNQIILWSLAYSVLILMTPLFFPVGAITLIILVCLAAWILYELVQYIKIANTQTWLKFFLAVNFSLIIILVAVVADLWYIHFMPRS